MVVAQSTLRLLQINEITYITRTNVLVLVTCASTNGKMDRALVPALPSRIRSVKTMVQEARMERPG